jgi:hypothetical protein
MGAVAFTAAVLIVTTNVAAQSRVTFDQAAAVFSSLSSNLPRELRGRSTQELARLWPSWIEQHDRDVRARLARGDEDSLVNFWLYGTSFTSRPPAVAPRAIDDIITGRLEDLLDRVTAPGDNERLQFARRILIAHNADPRDASGRERARRFLLDTRQRMIREFAATEQTLAAARPGGAATLTAANATIFRERGLSSDTAILSDFRRARRARDDRATEDIRATQRAPCRDRWPRTRFHEQGRRLRLLSATDDPALRADRHASPARTRRG